MNKKNILVAAGLLFLATACKESEVIVPSSPTVQKETPAPKLQGDSVNDEVDTSKGKPAKVKDNTPVTPYLGDPKLSQYNN